MQQPGRLLTFILFVQDPATKERFPDGCVKVHWGKPSGCLDEEWFVDAVEQLANKMECIPCEYAANKAFMVRVLLPLLPFSFEACLVHILVLCAAYRESTCRR